jgi:hypothetical protein
MELYNVQYWSNEEKCWRFEIGVSAERLRAIIKNPNNERVDYAPYERTWYI